MSNIKTTCGHCIFAEWQDWLSIIAPHYKAQEGCSLNRLKKFKDKTVIYGEYDERDFQKRYYEIDGYCSACRQKEWVNSDDPIQQIYDELDKKTTIDIIVGITEENTQEDLANFLNNIGPMTKWPVFIHFIIFENHNVFKPTEFTHYLYTELSGICKWKAEYILEKEPNDIILARAVNKVNSMFTLFAKLKSVIPVTLLMQISDWVNKDLKNISLIESENWCVIQTRLYKMLAQSNPFDINQQIKDLAKEHKEESMIISYE